jgi:hypothetical protein
MLINQMRVVSGGAFGASATTGPDYMASMKGNYGLDVHW